MSRLRRVLVVRERYGDGLADIRIDRHEALSKSLELLGHVEVDDPELARFRLDGFLDFLERPVGTPHAHR